MVLGLFEDLRGIGEAYLGLLRAELGVLLGRFKRTAIGAGKAAALGAGALYLLLLCVPALLIFALVDLLSSKLGWPYWQSALAVVGAVMLVILVLALLARRIWVREVESPAISVQRRLDDHRGWWHERLMYERPEIGDGGFDDDFRG